MSTRLSHTPAIPVTDWDDAYANRDHIPDAEAFIRRWPEQAADYRSALAQGQRFETLGATDADLSKGQHACDLFWPDGSENPATDAGFAVFVHGGYWMRFSRRDWSHLAAGCNARGLPCALPGYPLCPGESVAGIESAVARAIEAVAARIDGPIRLAGHSAGGQIVTRLLCRDGALAPAVRERVVSVLSISGVHDLVPLCNTSMNTTLGLDSTTAIAASPARGLPTIDCRYAAWVGADERPAFIDQSRLLALAWNGVGAAVDLFVEDERHHFNVIDALQTPDSPMLRWWLDV